MEFEHEALRRVHDVLQASPFVVELAAVSEAEDGVEYGISTYLSAYEGVVPLTLLTELSRDTEVSSPDLLDIIEDLKKRSVA